MAKVRKRHREDATKLLNKMIEWTEEAGQLSGRKGAKRLSFSDILVNGKAQPVYPFLIEDFSHYLAEREEKLLKQLKKKRKTS